MNVFKAMIHAKKEINIFVNSYNPIKLLISVSRLLESFAKVTYNLESVYEEVRKEAEMLIVKIIEEK